MNARMKEIKNAMSTFFVCSSYNVLATIEIETYTNILKIVLWRIRKVHRNVHVNNQNITGLLGKCDVFISKHLKVILIYDIFQASNLHI